MKFKKLARTFRQETPEAGCAEREAAPVLDPAPAHTLVLDASPGQESCEPAQPYTSNHEHLAEELQRLDLRLKLSMLEAGQLDSELALMNGEIRSLLDAQSADEDDGNLLTVKLSMLEQRIAARLEASSGQEVQLMLPQVASSLNLSGLEVSILVACLAPELDRKYARIYAFLQNDMSDQRPTAGFVLGLFTGSAEERLAARLLFDANAPLMKLLLERRGNTATAAYR
ncbi:hypothetical protein JI735_29185 [Paenibacillus sonchi]|uniref:Winged helix domain-containing protein n=1 Tax=Paenibacillus sonchi TaxID=373687 RepID=A0A974SDN9_9BACL|nr:hypothetical protein [Paenibacillus sonchi]QQZ60520.1 hypothetical protein JI735_29185 [Paenibacillus sonchi]